MIQSIEIQNRQSWESGRLDLAPGVNLLIGRGTSGKSAILRAFRWALENPSGESQISHWIKRTTKGGKKVLDGESSVTITKPEGVLKRFRNPEANGYQIDNVTLKAIGTGVPEEVQAFFNLSETNIQGQHDRPFLISLPGSQVSAYLNRVVGIEEIDKYLGAATSCIREATKKHKALVEAQEADQKALEALSWVDGIQDGLKALDALEARKSLAESQLAGIRTLRQAIEEATAKRDKALKVAQLSEGLQEAKRLSQAVSGVSSRLSSVSRLAASWRTTEEARDRASQVSGLSGQLEVCKGLLRDISTKTEETKGLRAWVSGVRAVKESLIVTSKVARLSSDLQALRASRVALESEESCLYGLHRLCSDWVRLDAVAQASSRVAALEPLLSRVKKASKVLGVRKAELESLKEWGLTIKGIQRTLEIKRSEVSGLEAKRPERCPLCGGAYGKECG